MRNASLLVSGAALVLAGVAVAQGPLFRGAPVESVDPRGLDAASLAELERRVARLEEASARPRLEPADGSARLADLEARLGALEGRATTPAAPTAPAPASAPAPAPVALVDMKEKDLLARARRLTKGGVIPAGDAEEGLRAWEEVLRRRPDAVLEREAWIGAGFAYRVLEQHDKEEEAFREAIRAAGADETAAQEARYQLGWAQSFLGDLRQARDTMAETVRIGKGSKQLIGHARLYEADWSLRLEDAARAREALDAIVRDLSDSVDPSSTWLVAQAKERLQRLDKR